MAALLGNSLTPTKQTRQYIMKLHTKVNIYPVLDTYQGYCPITSNQWHLSCLLLMVLYLKYQAIHMLSATHIIPNTTIAIMMYGYPSKLLKAIRIFHQN